MSNKVWVVTSVERGWDCVVGVYSKEDYSEEYLQEVYPREFGYIIHDKQIYSESNPCYTCLDYDEEV